MVALSFKGQFAQPIRLGIKQQTIRAPRRQPIKAGDVLHLFTGMRTKHCRRIGEAVCSEVHHIAIHLAESMIRFDGRTLTSLAELNRFAQSDGFTGWADMRQFWEDTHPGDLFEGTLIRWGGFKPAETLAEALP